MAISLVQTAKGNAGGYVNSISKALGSSATAGNLLVAAISVGDTADITSVSDTQSNTWTKIEGSAGDTSGTGISLWYAKNIAAGATTVTANLGDGSQYNDLVIMIREYSGLDTTSPLDKSASVIETGYDINHTSGATATTTQASELVVGALTATENPSTATAGSGYGNLATEVGSDLYSSVAMEDKIVSATGAQTATFATTNYTKGAVAVATFKEAVSAAQNLTLPFIASTTVMYPPTVTTGAVSLTLPFIASTNTLYPPTVAQTISPPQIASTTVMYPPTIAAAGVTLQLPLLSNVNTMYAPVVTTGPTTISPPQIASTNTLYPPSITTGAVSISLPTITSTVVLYPPRVQRTLSMPFIASTNVMYQMVVTRTPRLRKPRTAYGSLAKPRTAYMATPERQTSYSRITKPLTSYAKRAGMVPGVQLDDMTVTLDSLTVYLNGYLTPDAADILPKRRTTYGAVTKPRTTYR